MGLGCMMLALVAQFIGVPDLRPDQGTGGPRVDASRLQVRGGGMVDALGGRMVWVRHRVAR